MTMVNTNNHNQEELPIECSQCRDMMLEVFYNERRIDDRDRFDHHIAACSECAQLMREMTEALTMMNTRFVPEPRDEYLRNVTEHVRHRIAARARPENSMTRFRWRPERIPAWTYAAAAIILITFGVFLGRIFFHIQESSPETHSQTPKVATIPEDSVNASAIAYLERSRNVLLGVVNLPGSDVSRIDFSRQREVSQQLITQASYLKTALSNPDQQQLRQLVRDLEIILLQLANIEPKPGVPVVQLIQKGVDQKSILLKINLEVMRSFTKSPGNPKRVSKPNL